MLLRTSVAQVVSPATIHTDVTCPFSEESELARFNMLTLTRC
jgi:hypothetical protein